MEQQILQPNAQDVNLDCSLSGYNYELPPGRIAQNPAVPRDSSKLLVVNSPETAKTIPPLNHIFRDLPELLKPGDLLVMNNTKVIPARLYGYKSTGGSVEVLLLEERRHNCWLALVKPGKRFKVGNEIIFTDGEDGKKQELRAVVVESDPETGGRLLQFDLPAEVPLVQVLGKFGQIPLPPYITASTAADEQYQTVYAEEEGAIAAPTAGLHFTPELLEKLNRETYAKVIMPRMLSGHLQGRVLSMFSKMIQPKRILEVGTYTGYSAIC
ncbi:MAG: S-adenosylmethionine:tRNA ribosyltransferase-isomerase, partial [Dolichospermum sp.]|nr:S-adenosylmethionine:tRNA ribosyltransferase-isomerase [Dolichospermum sp.]